MADKSKFNEYLARLEAQLVIDVELLKAATALDFNIADNKLIQAAYNAQRTYLEPMIGSKLTRRLQNSNLTFEYQLLKDKFLDDAMVNWAAAESIQGVAYQIAEGGVFKHYSSDSEVATKSEVNTIRQSYLNRADIFARDLISFLNKNKSYYPEYTENAADGVNATKYAAYTGGLNIEASRSVPTDDINIPSGVYVGCGSRVGNSDPSIFEAETYWGNSDEMAMGFNPATLEFQSNTVPPLVTALPQNDYFWVVSSTDIDIAQAGVPIPTVGFDDTNADTEIFVKGVQDNKTWLRIKIAEVYEQQVTFQILT